MSKSSWWLAGPKPGEDVVPDNVRPQRGKKDTRRWCKGKKGREHTPETVRHHYYAAPLFADKGCGWQEYWSYRNGERVALRDKRWRCLHAIQCTTCGKYLNSWLGAALCPDYKEDSA